MDKSSLVILRLSGMEMENCVVTQSCWTKNNGCNNRCVESWKCLVFCFCVVKSHYCDVIMGAMASQITSVSIVYSTISSGADQRKYQSSISLAFVRRIHRWPVSSLHKGPVMRKMFPLKWHHHDWIKFLLKIIACFAFGISQQILLPGCI